MGLTTRVGACSVKGSIPGLYRSEPSDRFLASPLLLAGSIMVGVADLLTFYFFNKSDRDFATSWFILVTSRVWRFCANESMSDAAAVGEKRPFLLPRSLVAGPAKPDLLSNKELLKLSAILEGNLDGAYI